MRDDAYKFRKVFSRMAEENVQLCDYFKEMEIDSKKKKLGKKNMPSKRGGLEKS